MNLFSIDDKYSRNIFLQKKIKNKVCFSLQDKSADFYIGEGYILDNYSKVKAFNLCYIFLLILSLIGFYSALKLHNSKKKHT